MSSRSGFARHKHTAENARPSGTTEKNSSRQSFAERIAGTNKSPLAISATQSPSIAAAAAATTAAVSPSLPGEVAASTIAKSSGISTPPAVEEKGGDVQTRAIFETLQGELNAQLDVAREQAARLAVDLDVSGKMVKRAEERERAVEKRERDVEVREREMARGWDKIRVREQTLARLEKMAHRMARKAKKVLDVQQ